MPFAYEWLHDLAILIKPTAPTLYYSDLVTFYKLKRAKDMASYCRYNLTVQEACQG
jgi:hypothetical protein